MLPDLTYSKTLLAFNFFLTCRYIILRSVKYAVILYCGQSNYEFKYLGEFITEFENILEYESGAQVRSFDGISGGRKSRATVPLSILVFIA